MLVKERFKLNEEIVKTINSMIPNFGYGVFGEIVFYTRYSRTKEDGSQESWNDVVLRVTEGIFSIRKDWYMKNNIHWDEDFWQHLALHFAQSMFRMEWLPPGRGLWAMGTDMVYNRGAMAVNNCAFSLITDDIAEDCAWVMDALMNGVGVGFTPVRNDDTVAYQPNLKHQYLYQIPDSREGWCESIKKLINSYLVPNSLYVVFDYSLIRGPGEKIKTFGGTASGPQPLMDLHDRIRDFFERYLYEDGYDSVMLKTDIVNCIGCCVVAGNVRRSAEIALAPIDDPAFIDLKDYENPKYGYRATHGWMSNNSVILEKPEDFTRLGEIAKRVAARGEPGYVNANNLYKGRIGKNDNLRHDDAIGFNPCGEIPLEDKELCNIAETLPTNCNSLERWLKACEYATIYCSTISLLPTHQPATNKVVVRNRRIGISLVDYTGWVSTYGQAKVITCLRQGYNRIRKVNKWLANEAGVPESIRVCAVKPGGTVPKLPGKTPGAGYPTFSYTLRRIRISILSPMFQLLADAGIPHEPDVNEPDYTHCFEIPILQGPSKPASEVSIWDQAINLITLQREWADNAVSNTIYFKPEWELIEHGFHNSTRDDLNLKILELTDYHIGLLDGVFEDECCGYRLWLDQDYCEYKVWKQNKNHEEGLIETVLAAIAPLTKSVSLLPHTAKGVYKQMPEEGITEEEYYKRLAAIKPISWSSLTEHEAEPERYCTSDRCEL